MASVLAVPLVVSGLVLTSSAAANASSEADSDAAVEQTLIAKAKEADAKGYVLLDRSEGERVGDAVFYPTGPVSDETVVVVKDADGSLPNGLTEETLAREVAAIRAGVGSASVPADDRGAASPLAADSYAWGATSAGYSDPFRGGSAIGWDDSATVSYSFFTNPGYNQRASGEGLGFYRGYNGSEFGTWQKYYYVGTGGSTGAGGSVPWGNTAATKYFRAICTQTVACGGYFQ
ncbi:MAG: hypothetical protein PIR02_17255 [Microbacterium enclense]